MNLEDTQVRGAALAACGMAPRGAALLVTRLNRPASHQMWPRDLLWPTNVKESSTCSFRVGTSRACTQSPSRSFPSPTGPREGVLLSSRSLGLEMRREWSRAKADPLQMRMGANKERSL